MFMWRLPDLQDIIEFTWGLMWFIGFVYSLSWGLKRVKRFVVRLRAYRRMKRLESLECRLLLANLDFVSFGESLSESDIVIAVEIPSLPRGWRVEVDGSGDGYSIDGTCWYNDMIGMWEILGFSVEPLNHCQVIGVTIIPGASEDEVKRIRWKRTVKSLDYSERKYS